TIDIPKLPSYNSGSMKIFVMGSNNCGQLGLMNVDEVNSPKHVENLDKFKIVYLSAGSLHTAALMQDGKVVTWGALGRITVSDDDEKVPSYAQGLDNITIIKVACSGNITLALSRDG
ncbi:371_t:CDS:2, partial [Ambispora leptoticha]